MQEIPDHSVRPGTPPSCAFCGQTLSEAAWFKYELELSAFDAQSPLVAPEAGDHNPFWRAPLTYCDDCRKSVSDNAALRKQEEDDEDALFRTVVRWFVPTVLGICLLILLVDWLK